MGKVGQFFIDGIKGPNYTDKFKCANCGATFTYKVKKNSMVKVPNNCPTCCKKGK